MGKGDKNMHLAYQAFCDWTEEQHGEEYEKPCIGRISLPTK